MGQNKSVASGVLARPDQRSLDQVEQGVLGRARLSDYSNGQFSVLIMQ